MLPTKTSHIDIGTIENYSDIFKDYTSKISNKIFDAERISPKDLNNLIVLFNWCFRKKNSFFVKQYNPIMIPEIGKLYNLLKNNILVEEKIHVLSKLTKPQLRAIIFILNRYIKIYDDLLKNTKKSISKNNQMLDEIFFDNDLYYFLTVVDKQSMTNLFQYLQYSLNNYNSITT